MIKISKNDNIFDILYKIEKENSSKSKIILEFPFGHPVLHNYFYLKTLVNKYKDKKIIIVTTDLASKKIGKNLGIKYSLIKNTDFIEKEENNILKYNYSFLEYAKYELKKYLNLFKSKIFKNKKLNSIKHKYKNQKINLGIFIFMLSIVGLIFLYIFFFALNKTTIYITPEIEVQTKSKNFIFNSQNSIYQRKNEEKVKKFSKHINLEYNYKTTGIKQEKKYKAKTTINFINKFPQEIKLLPNTRLLSSSGILFETQNWVKIPAAKKNNAGELIPGIKEADIIAKTFDNKGIFIGARANTTATGILLTLPGLKEEQDKLFAKTITPIYGGKDIYTHIVSKDDLENSKKILKEKLRKKAIEEINKQIENENKTNNITYKILNIDNIFKFNNVKINSPKNISAGQELKDFYISGSLDASTYAYNIDSIISKLKDEINASIIPEKEKVLSINDKSIRISNVIYRQDNPFYLKATIEIEYFVEYNFENEDDSYIERLKATIAGIPKEEAEKILINENKISDVKIEIKPFFLKKISPFFKNIEFIIEK